MGAHHVYLLVPALKPTREGAQGGAPSDIQVAPVAQRRWVQIPCLGILLVSHVNQVIQPLFLSYYFLAEFASGAWVSTKPINFAWASKIGPEGPQCLLSFGRTGRRLWPT